MARKTIEGFLFHEIEVLGGKKVEHLGFRDEKNRFGELLAGLVPEAGVKRKARITIETLDGAEE